MNSQVASCSQTNIQNTSSKKMSTKWELKKIQKREKVMNNNTIRKITKKMVII